MSTAFLLDERLADLLTQRATEGLTASERLELERLLECHGRPDGDVIDRTAASLLLAGTLEPEALPEHLRNRLNAAADAFIATELGSAAGAVVQFPRAQRSRAGNSRQAAPARWAWAVAAALAVIAVAGWWPRSRSSIDAPVARVPAVPDIPAAELSLEQRRERLAAAAATIEVPWTATEDPAARTVRGDVIWNPASQSGFMRFRGLAANDPSREQYQLWVFDGSRPGCEDLLGPDCRPVDGGVFDAPGGTDEIVVPVDAKLPVGRAGLFAVTVERPGGVVVSARERIVVLAAVAAG